MVEKTGKETTASNEFKYRGIRAMPFVIGAFLNNLSFAFLALGIFIYTMAGNETFEKLGTIGTSSNLLVYLTTVFNLKAITATNIINVFNGTCNFGALLGAFVSDTFWGRYKTLGFASVSSFLGMLGLTLTAAIRQLHPQHSVHEDNGGCNIDRPTRWQIAFLLSSFGFLVIGASGIRPCNLAFGADQFDPNTASGRRGTNSFFNWYYFTYTFAAMVSFTIIVYVQSSISWALGLAIPAILMFFSCVMFFAGTKIYVKVLPKGSPLASTAQVIVAAIKKRQLEFPQQPRIFLFDHVPTSSTSINTKISYTDQFRFLSKAAIITPEDQIKADESATDPWKLCSIQQIEEVKCVLRVIPIWVAGVIYYVTVVQEQNYAVFQALQSNRRLGNTNFHIPAASYNLFSMLIITIWLPLYDRLIVPCLRRLTGKEDGLSLLQKIGIGLVLSIAAMLVSGLVESRRKMMLVLTIPEKSSIISSMSGMWLIPQIALSGLSEVFALIGENELLYKQFPENMRSIASAFLFVGLAVSSYLSSFFTSLIHRTTNWLADDDDLNHGKLDYFYYSIAAMQIVNLGYFLFCAKWYRYKATENTINQAKEKLQIEISALV